MIDARERVVLPGFVDTHRHGWQSVLRAAALDVDLAGYLDRVAGRLAPALDPADVATASLLTGLECLDAGITTVQDHAHIVYTPEHAAAVVEGLQASGVRAVFGYGRPVLDEPRPWFAGDVRRVRTDVLPGDDGLVTMMLAATVRHTCRSRRSSRSGPSPGSWACGSPCTSVRAPWPGGRWRCCASWGSPSPARSTW
ncbi:amidohydrolase family protein [Pseudonocardia cypriaca]|uniref:Amidohydrolase family protein n=1 Tax=Pseudonocardia cypriaca TaxID=882449 RepID=A0A543GGW4_9PSEU|nr:amidohydrolase family protein [Pseudonocardia cypriaca]TQM45311.1 amidohydrolase family protein [Pseudonocardia cypriaca]